MRASSRARTRALCVSSTPHSSQTRSTLGLQAHAVVTTIRISTYSAHVVRRKNITIREDQAEWVEENHLNLSSFVRGKLDELIEERS